MVLVIGPRAKATWTTRKYDKPQDEDVDLPGSRAGINGTLLTPLQVTRPKISPSVRSVGVTENPGSTWHQAEGQSHNKMFIMECGGLERLAGPAEGGHWQQELLGPPGRVGEHDGSLLGPAGEHSLLSNEAMGTPWRLLMQKVHLTLVQPALFKVVVRHGGATLLTVGREQGQVGHHGTSELPASGLRFSYYSSGDTHIWTDVRRPAAVGPNSHNSETASWVTLGQRSSLSQTARLEIRASGTFSSRASKSLKQCSEDW